MEKSVFAFAGIEGAAKSVATCNFKTGGWGMQKHAIALAALAASMVATADSEIPNPADVVLPTHINVLLPAHMAAQMQAIAEQRARDIEAGAATSWGTAQADWLISKMREAGMFKEIEEKATAAREQAKTQKADSSSTPPAQEGNGGMPPEAATTETSDGSMWPNVKIPDVADLGLPTHVNVLVPAHMAAQMQAIAEQRARDIEAGAATSWGTAQSDWLISKMREAGMFKEIEEKAAAPSKGAEQ